MVQYHTNGRPYLFAMCSMHFVPIYQLQIMRRTTAGLRRCQSLHPGFLCCLQMAETISNEIGLCGHSYHIEQSVEIILIIPQRLPTLLS